MPQTGQAGGLADELEPYVDVAEVESFNRMGELLRSRRPTPRPGVLASVSAGSLGEGPGRVWPQAALALIGGLLLFGLAALGASGSGPLGG